MAPQKPPARSSGLTLVGLLAGAVLVAIALGQLSPEPSPRTPAVALTTVPEPSATPAPDVPIGVDSIRRCQVRLGGLMLGDHLSPPGSALERWQCDALQGPWSVVIRATRGTFGVHSAVVTYPVDRTGTGLPSTRPPDGVWYPSSQKLVWPIGSSLAQIVGDVGQSTLENLATRVSVEGGKPHFKGQAGFVVSASMLFGAPVVHEMRYGAKDLGHQRVLGDGLVFTGVTSGASFESLAFESRAKASGVVRGKPAIYTEGQGGNGSLAWQEAPGLVHYIGYSGKASSAGAIEALRALASKARLLTPAQWQMKDRHPVGTDSG